MSALTRLAPHADEPGSCSSCGWHWARDGHCAECGAPACGIPTTRDLAINALIEQDVARWGESERDASRRIHGTRSYGLALNALANRAELAGRPDRALRAAANKALTDADWRELRRGG